MPRSIIDFAITALLVLYVGLMAVFLGLILTDNITPAGAGWLGLTACAAIVAWHLLRRVRKRLLSA